jgi:hypothetical protein
VVSARSCEVEWAAGPGQESRELEAEPGLRNGGDPSTLQKEKESTCG